MIRKIWVAILVVSALLASIRVAAEDIDLFVGRSTQDTDAPNVLLVLDNTGNWGPLEKFNQQKAALIEVLESVVADDLDVNVGLMMYTETSADDTGPDGGYVRAAIRPLNGVTLPYFTQMIGDPNDPNDIGLDVIVDRSNSGKAGKTMAEAYLYFFGGNDTWERPYSGNRKAKTDYKGNEYVNSNGTCCEGSHPIWGLETDGDGNPLNALLGGTPIDAKNATQYNSPVDPNDCAENYIIFIGNGPANDSNADHEEARQILQNMEDVGPYYSASYVAGEGEPDFQLTPPNSEDNLADEWAYYMNNDAPTKVTTYAIDIQILSNAEQCENNAPLGWSKLMESMSKTHGGGKYYRQCGTAFNPDEFALNLADAFRGILSRNSVFASVALPAAANEQSTFLNQVFVGMFRPNSSGLPVWAGNLKQYQIGLDGSELRVVDADGAPLVDTSDTDNGGFVEGCARSFWTPTSESPVGGEYYWDYLADLTKDTDSSNDPVENCEGAPAGSNSPDGNIVEKGGQAYVLRGTSPSSREVLTCDPTLLTCNSVGLLDFDPLNLAITAAALDANDPVTDRAELINWAIGYDVDDEDQDLNVLEMRPSVHMDIVHAQPVAMDYAGDPNNPEVVVFYGGNDGLLRAINGSQTDSHGGVAPGAEFWAYMPPEFYGAIKRLRLNEEYIQFPASGPTAGQGVPGTPKDYGMDGPLSAYELDLDEDGTVDERVLLAGMRRAGRMIYSFDVTSKDSPTLNWKIGCPNPTGDTDCTSADWAELGQTWSRLFITYAEGYDPDVDGIERPIIIMGGGYDPCEDEDDGSAVNNSCGGAHSKIGNRIYVMDAITGQVLKSFPTDRSVPGKVTVVPVSDDDPRIMFAYAADMGGNVYRISAGTEASGSDPAEPAIIGDTDPADWIITKIASLGCNTVTSCDANRKFLFGPDVIRIPNTQKLGILIGSGDREKPLLDYSVTSGVSNYFYSLVDFPTSSTWLDDSANSEYSCADNDLLCHASLTTIDPIEDSGDSFDNELSLSPWGWKMEMRPGEQIVTGAITLDNQVNFSTHIPATPQTCDAEYGLATAYSVNYADAEGTSTKFIGGGLVPTPVAGKVLIDGKKYPFCIGCGDEGSPIGAGKVGGGINWTQPRSRVFWNVDKVED